MSPTVMPSTTSHAAWLSTATALFFTWAFLTLVVRVWVKLRRSETWGWDDWAISAAFAVALGHIVATFYAVNDNYGKPSATLSAADKAAIEKSLFAAGLLYIFAMGLSRVSVALFIGRLTRYGPQVKVALVLAALSGLWAFASLFVVGFRGNAAAPWETLDGTQPLYVRWIAVEAVGLFVEATLFALCINLVWRLNMGLRKRVLILGAFGCRLLLFPIVALRLHFLSPSQNSDPLHTTIVAGVLTEAVLDFSLFSASVTCLKPFLQPFHSGYIVNSVGDPGSGLRSGNRSKSSADPYYILSNVSASAKDGTLVSVNERGRPQARQSMINRPGPNPDQPYQGEYSHFSATANSSGNDDGEIGTSRKSEGSSHGGERPMVITQTKTVVVSESRMPS